MAELSNRQLLAQAMQQIQSDSKKEEDDDQKFIKKEIVEQPQEEANKSQNTENIEASSQNAIKPESNQQRNLDREVGGLEDEEQKENSNKDVWDDRSEEVDKMGSTDTFNTTSMKSVVWKQKRDRLAKKRAAKHHAEAAGAAIENQSKKSEGSDFDNMGYVARLRNMKQDRSHENKGGRGI